MDADRPTVAKAKKAPKNPDSLTLAPEHLAKLDTWCGQVLRSSKGIRMNRGKVLDWLLKTTPSVLTESQVQEMSAQNFDEELFMRQTLEEMKRMKAEGKPVDIQDIVKELTLSMEGRKVIRRRPATPAPSAPCRPARCSVRERTAPSNTRGKTRAQQGPRHGNKHGCQGAKESERRGPTKTRDKRAGP